ncbi:hypothetical protein B0H13DRAFT_1865998 [Mycena leptocephala]|nr:hypothetical protein B0H13DRAFT_1865998 [Mycena leptocephala]
MVETLSEAKARRGDLIPPPPPRQFAIDDRLFAGPSRFGCTKFKAVSMWDEEHAFHERGEIRKTFSHLKKTGLLMAAFEHSRNAWFGAQLGVMSIVQTAVPSNSIGEHVTFADQRGSHSSGKPYMPTSYFELFEFLLAQTRPWVALGNVLGGISPPITDNEAISFLLFTVGLLLFGARFHAILRSLELTRSPPVEGFVKAAHCRRLANYILHDVVGILIRSIFRNTEFAGGYSGTIGLHEVYFYVFDVPVTL